MLERLRGLWGVWTLGVAIGCGSGSSSTTSPDQGTGGGASSGGSAGSSSGGAGDGGPGGGTSGASSSGSAASSEGGSGSSSGAASSGSSGSSGAADGSALADAASVWRPTSSAPIHFHWMIGASTFTSQDVLSGQNGAVAYDIDGANATAADVAAIHASGAIAVCYVDVGSLEPGRPDYASFPSSVVGPAVQGWPGENWLLVTAANQSTILPLMRSRFVNWCQAKGFDAIEPDNLDAWSNISSVSQADNVAYDLAIAALAHSLPLSVGLKNVMSSLSASQYPTFVVAFDWALDEQCYEYGEYGVYSAAGSFLPAGKAVFDVEYNVDPTCAQANQVHMNSQRTDLNLVGAVDNGYTYAPCVPDSQATW